MKLSKITSDLARQCDELKFRAPTALVYNPLVYAAAPYQEYLRRFGQGTREIVLVGMNPGPFGMAQTGVPFGDVKMVTQWLGITGHVDKPKNEHPKKTITGFNCKRSEVSGTRVWTWAKERYGTADEFFSRFFVLNYCPLIFLEEGGKNRTPDKLPASERDALFEVCDLALKKTVQALKAKWVIGIGAFAEQRILSSVDESDFNVGRILHPSPASPLANKGWAAQAEANFASLGIEL